jgi:hypothetical protein
MIKVGDSLTVTHLEAEDGTEDTMNDKLSLGVNPGDKAKITAIHYNNKSKMYKTIMVNGDAKGKTVDFYTFELDKVTLKQHEESQLKKHNKKLLEIRMEARHMKAIAKYLIKRSDMVIKMAKKIEKKKVVHKFKADKEYPAYDLNCKADREALIDIRKRQAIFKTNQENSPFSFSD